MLLNFYSFSYETLWNNVVRIGLFYILEVEFKTEKKLRKIKITQENRVWFLNYGEVNFLKRKINYIEKFRREIRTKPSGN